MRKIIAGILLALIVILVFPLAVQAQQGGGDGRDPQFEQQIYDRLDAIDSQAVAVFQAAPLLWMSEVMLKRR